MSAVARMSAPEPDERGGQMSASELARLWVLQPWMNPPRTGISRVGQLRAGRLVGLALAVGGLALAVRWVRRWLSAGWRWLSAGWRWLSAG
jgi:hypothetical protein